MGIGDEVDNFIDLEVPHLSESDKIKLRLKKFCCAIGILFILWIISIIIIIVSNNKSNGDNNGDSNGDSNSDSNKEDPTHDTQDDSIPKDENYIKAKAFIANFTSQDIERFLNGKNNINKKENENICEGEIAPFNSSLYPNDVSFKGMCIQDGTKGILFSGESGIIWQSEINTAATFNIDLMYKIGKAQGAESREKGINTLLSPSVNIMKNPKEILWESFGEDPFYSGVCGSQIIRGIQESGVIAAIKNFLGNDQKEYDISQLTNGDINALMDIYVEPIYRAIHEEDVRAVMVGSNIFNGDYCYKNEYLLTNILRNNLSFNGFIMSYLWDYQNYSSSLLDLNLQEKSTLEPSNKVYKSDNLKINHSNWNTSEKYLKNQIVNEERFNESATRIIAAMYKMKQMEDYPKVNLNRKTIKEERKEIQKQAAKESQVLLKNEDNILPLKNFKKLKKKIYVIGNIAIERNSLIEKLESINGKTIQNSKDIYLEYYSQNNNFDCLISPLEEIKKLFVGIEVFSPINMILNEKKNDKKAENFKISINIEKWLDDNVKDKHEVFIFFLLATSDESSIVEIIEGKKIYILHGVKQLIEAVSRKVGKNIIVVINAPFLEELSWIKEVKAVIFSGFPGAEAGNAIAEILYGNDSPSGHLPFTWGKLNVDKEYKYPDGLYIGQRWFNKYNPDKYLFPFGFGLSYTSFKYSELKLSINKKGLIAEFNVKNIGSYPGQAVPMMFMNFPDNIGEYPKYIFKGFYKVELKPDETKRVNITVDDHALSYFKDNKYIRVDKGTFGVIITENGNMAEPKIKETIEANYIRDEKE